MVSWQKRPHHGDLFFVVRAIGVSVAIWFDNANGCDGRVQIGVVASGVFFDWVCFLSTAQSDRFNVQRNVTR